LGDVTNDGIIPGRFAAHEQATAVTTAMPTLCLRSSPRSVGRWAMRVFALSDIHVDHDANAQWISGLSSADYVSDVLILAGDVSDSLESLATTLGVLAKKFRQVLYVPGNHELWVIRDRRNLTSFEKFEDVCATVEQSGVSMKPFVRDDIAIVPLLSWYDYAFGQPSRQLYEMWMDYRACRWPEDFSMEDVARHFENSNLVSARRERMVISFSHFLPRVELVSGSAYPYDELLLPVLGSSKLDEQVRTLNSRIHVYGHSHVNRRMDIDGVTYVNNAFGYPRERWIASRQLLCIHST
jgi:predicted phosphodiesterase